MAATKCKSKVCNPRGPDGGGAGGADGVSPEVIAGCQELVLNDGHMKQYMDSFLDNVKRGLGKATNRTAIVKCFPTYVQDLPNGTEEGKFLALDLGGSNFRVLLVELGGGECKMDSKIYVIPQSIMTGPGVELFDFIAECLADFANQKGVMNEVLPLGFTFSFPLVQVGLTKGILERLVYSGTVYYRSKKRIN
nr:unnamed protein product [Callosobruchus chinensis]